MVKNAQVKNPILEIWKKADNETRYSAIVELLKLYGDPCCTLLIKNRRCKVLKQIDREQNKVIKTDETISD